MSDRPFLLEGLGVNVVQVGWTELANRHRIEGPRRGTPPITVEGVGPDTIDSVRLSEVHRGPKHGHAVRLRQARRSSGSRSKSSGQGVRVDVTTGTVVGYAEAEEDFRFADRRYGV